MTISLLGLAHGLLDPLEVLHQYALMGLLLLLLSGVCARIMLATALVLAALPYLLAGLSVAEARVEGNS